MRSEYSAYSTSAPLFSPDKWREKRRLVGLVGFSGASGDSGLSSFIFPIRFAI